MSNFIDMITSVPNWVLSKMLTILGVIIILISLNSLAKSSLKKKK
tara:strand:+ start:2472 stop:2606 length:135 start_codon:yes stop_codon:yes gene_type:complete